MRTDAHGIDSMNGAFSATEPLNPALQKVIVEGQRLHATLPAQGDVACSQKWCKNAEIFLTFTDYRNLIHSLQHKKLEMNAVKHTQVIILMMKFHNPVTGEVEKSCSFMKPQKKIQAIQTYANLGLFNRAAGVREAYREYHISFR